MGAGAPAQLHGVRGRSPAVSAAERRGGGAKPHTGGFAARFSGPSTRVHQGGYYDTPPRVLCAL